MIKRIVLVGAMKTLSLATVGVSIGLIRAKLSYVVTTTVAFTYAWLVALRIGPCVLMVVTWTSPSVKASVTQGGQK